MLYFPLWFLLFQFDQCWTTQKKPFFTEHQTQNTNPKTFPKNLPTPFSPAHLPNLPPMTSPYTPYASPALPGSLNFAKEEEKIAKLWDVSNTFHLQNELSASRADPEFTFYDGPPFATGLPHYGHILAGTIQDTVTRYAAMTGHQVERRAGWDCHGLPVEYEIDQKLKITHRQQVLDMGIENYNNEVSFWLAFRPIPTHSQPIPPIPSPPPFSADPS